jgi:hypothetical protein
MIVLLGLAVLFIFLSTKNQGSLSPNADQYSTYLERYGKKYSADQ